MYLVERHIIKKSNSFYNDIDEMAFKSKNLYNVSLYTVRQEYIKNGNYLNYYKIRKQLQDTKQFDYVQLPSKVAQETIRVLDKNFKSFFKAINEYKKNPSKFTGRPKLPHYLDKDNGRFILIFTNQAFSKKVLEKTHQIKVSGLENPICSTELSYKDINQVRIVRENDTYVVELVYTVDTMDLKEDNGRYAGIDLGLNNLITVVSNVDGYVPFAVSGKPLKAMNQYYNKKLSESRSILETRNKKKSSRYTKRLTNKRNNKVNDYLHKTSRYLVNQLVSSNITKVVIGYNKGWKQDINIGHKNNQNFVQIPYRKLVDMIIYKCRLVGIEVIEQNESYSSKCSFLDSEPVKKHKIYVGKRIVRGLFKAGDGRLINADVNGAYNILFKCKPNAYANGVQDVIVHPVLIKITNQ